MQFWHELSDDEQVKVKSGFDNFNIDIRNEYIPPDWCKFSRALHKFGGCWPLLHGLVHGSEAVVCKSCNYHKQTKDEFYN